jgi:predicted nuclease of predicted toxin-antitoxin system
VRVLLDECVPADFRHHLRGHEAHSVRWAGFAGLTDREMLDAAEADGYVEVLEQTINRIGCGEFVRIP